MGLLFGQQQKKSRVDAGAPTAAHNLPTGKI
jgi:hypothetical protein